MAAVSRTTIIAISVAIFVLVIGVGITLMIRRRNSRQRMWEIASQNESRIAAMERTGVHSKFTITGARSGNNTARSWHHVRSEPVISASPSTIVKTNTAHVAIVVDKPETAKSLSTAAALGSATSAGGNAHDFVWPFLQHSVTESAMSDYSESGRSTATGMFVEPFEFVTEQREPSAGRLATFTPRKA
ncbi:hypothetical protein HK100_004976, partial [Physocladia obscura]